MPVARTQNLCLTPLEKRTFHVLNGRHLSLKSMQKDKPVHTGAPNGTTTAGDVTYLCDSTSGPEIAYVFAETQFFPMQSSGVWMVSWLYSFIAASSSIRGA